MLASCYLNLHTLCGRENKLCPMPSHGHVRHEPNQNSLVPNAPAHSNPRYHFVDSFLLRYCFRQKGYRRGSQVCAVVLVHWTTACLCRPCSSCCYFLSLNKSIPGRGSVCQFQDSVRMKGVLSERVPVHRVSLSHNGDEA